MPTCCLRLLRQVAPASVVAANLALNPHDESLGDILQTLVAHGADLDKDPDVVGLKSVREFSQGCYHVSPAPSILFIINRHPVVWGWA